MNKLHRKPRNENMYKAILTMTTVEECMQFFDDLCTVTISRVNRSLQFGRGGYEIAFDRLEDKEE